MNQSKNGMEDSLPIENTFSDNQCSDELSLDDELSPTTPAKRRTSANIFIESENKVKIHDQQERPNSAGRQRSPTKDTNDHADVSCGLWYKRISDLKLSSTKEMKVNTSSKQSEVSIRLKDATAAAESEVDLQEGMQGDDVTFTTSLSEAELEQARVRRERRRVEQETMLWKDNENKKRLSMEDVVEEKVQQHYNRGITEANEGRFETAVTCLNKALNLRPFDVSCYVERGEAFLQMCDFRSAYLNFKKAHSLEPNNSHVYGKLAFICYLEGQCLFDQALYTEALECFIRAADLKPNAKGYHMRAITCLAALGRNQECLSLVTRRLETEATGNPELFVLRARLHQQFGNATLCYYDVRDAMSLDPEQPQARDMMEEIQVKAGVAKQQALELTLQGKLNEALAKMTSAIQIDPSMAEFHILRGALLRRMKDFNGAIDEYLLTMDKSDHNEESDVYQDAQRQLLLTYNDFAVHCYQKGFFEEAVVLLNKAIKGEKKEKGLYVNRGDCFFKFNELGFALADYQQALELDPGCWATKCRISVVQNEFGIAAYQDKLYEEAIGCFTQAIDHNNKVGQYYVHRARALYMMEDVDGARKDVLVALHIDPDNDEIVPLLSRLFPGRSVSEILQSKIAENIRTQLLTCSSNPKLPPMSRLVSPDAGSKSKIPSTSKNPSIASRHSSWTVGEEMDSEVTSAEDGVPGARHLPSDMEILQAKKKISRDLKSILSYPVNLKSSQPKLLSATSSQQPPQPYNSSITNYGKWKRFGMGNIL